MSEETIVSTEYSEEMQQSYINYSMSVIMSRAVPDVRDGLKPVQRRVLYAMKELGTTHNKPHRKCARIVGDTMGKYHPHGDSSIYDALVVMSQDFKKEVPLVDGHGNFGSIEGDGAAAMRYTEARLTEFSEKVFLEDLDKDTVDFRPNFDENEKEPVVLPARISNLLVNGAEGIAVGMTTSIPSHHPGEVIDAMLMLLHKDASLPELMKCLPGPDFPTGGIVANASELEEIYRTGRGKIRLRGKAVIERAKKKTDKDKIVITELPYTMTGAGIGRFLTDTAALVEDRVLPEITDISNQTSKEGVRIVLELRKDSDPERVLRGLLQKTKLEDTFGVNMLAIHKGRPEVLGLKDILRAALDFQKELQTRKHRVLLEKEKEKKEVEEGLLRAVDVIDLILEILRGSRSLPMAKACLIEGKTEGIRFKTKKSEKEASLLRFTERQATAILELRLSKLIGLEIEALQASYEKTLKNIEAYTKILEEEDELKRVIEKELKDLRKLVPFERRTVLDDLPLESFDEKEKPVSERVLVLSSLGYLRAMEPKEFEKGTEEEGSLVIRTRTDRRIAFFTNTGQMHQVKVEELALSKWKDKGSPLDNVSGYDGGKEKTVYASDLADETRNLLFLTKSGLIKLVESSEFRTQNRSVLATKLADGDELLLIRPVEESESELLIYTDAGHYLCFPVSEVPLMKKTAQGVRALKLKKKEGIQGIFLFAEDDKGVREIGGKRKQLSMLKRKKRDQSTENL